MQQVGHAHERWMDHDTEYDVLYAEHSADAYRNDEPVAFICRECGQADETISEIVHEDWCSQAGDRDA